MLQKNQLQFETSPYLKQHETNPVQWLPWSEKAIALAQEQNKLILLSIGYSSCHWCHVMAHESFEDIATAKIMNELYINIKVDREERPDIDEIYMEAVQLLTGHGGWPLTVILTPDLKPLFGGTYFPPKPKYGQPSFKDVLVGVHNFFTEKKSEVIERVDEIISILNSRVQQNMSSDATPKIDPQSLLPQYFLMTEQLFKEADHANGGFGGAPKFPQPSKIAALLFSKREDCQSHALWTLKKMRAGGICDVIGGGFSRYSVDDHWTVPHFEKMLYDNVQLLPLYAEAAYVAKNSGQNGDVFSQTAIEIFNYLERDLTCKNSKLYFSAEDADSEHEEGKFYVFSEDEFTQSLHDVEKIDLLKKYFSVTRNGNFEGKNILERPLDENEFALQNNCRWEDLLPHVEFAKKKLYEVRQTRVRPGLDHKSLLSWNSLAVLGLLRTGLALENKLIFERGLDLIEQIFKNFVTDNAVFRVFTEGQAKIDLFFDDAAFLLEALSFALLATKNMVYMTRIKNLVRIIEESFYDEDKQIMFYSKKDALLPFRPMKPEDNVIYSPLSAVVRSANYLQVWFDSNKSDDKNLMNKVNLLSNASLNSCSNLIVQAPVAMTQMLSTIRWNEKRSVLKVKSADFLNKNSISFEDFALAYQASLTENTIVINCANDLGFTNSRDNTSLFELCNADGCQLPISDIYKVF